MLTGESLEQLHADVEETVRTLRASLAEADANTTRLAAVNDHHSAGFEMGRQAGLLHAISRLERILAESEGGE